MRKFLLKQKDPVFEEKEVEVHMMSALPNISVQNSNFWKISRFGMSFWKFCETTENNRKLL